MLKFKGLNKIYFGIGLIDDFRTCCSIEFYFYWFYLIRRSPQGEMLKRGRDYKGFNLRHSFRLPNFGINL